MRMLSKLSFLFFALLAVFVGLGGDLTGVVTKVSDGDTIWVGREKIRLQRIDAPESSQSFGGEATAFLRQMILGKSVRVEDQWRDRYGRMFGIVYLGGGEGRRRPFGLRAGDGLAAEDFSRDLSPATFDRFVAGLIRRFFWRAPRKMYWTSYGRISYNNPYCQMTKGTYHE